MQKARVGQLVVVEEEGGEEVAEVHQQLEQELQVLLW